MLNKTTNVSVLKVVVIIRISVLVPFGQYILKCIPDPFGWDKVGSVAANIIAERTKANGNSKAHVSGYLQPQIFE